MTSNCVYVKDEEAATPRFIISNEGERGEPGNVQFSYVVVKSPFVFVARQHSCLKISTK